MKPQVYHVDAFTPVLFAATQQVWFYMLMG